jgi:hypothetical protein
VSSSGVPTQHTSAQWWLRHLCGQPIPAGEMVLLPPGPYLTDALIQVAAHVECAARAEAGVEAER